jgi:hypothetical protein
MPSSNNVETMFIQQLHDELSMKIVQHDMFYVYDNFSMIAPAYFLLGAIPS